MSWDNFLRLFAEVTICRLRPDYVDARQGGWLPSVFGCGQGILIEVYARTQLELSIYQEVTNLTNLPPRAMTNLTNLTNLPPMAMTNLTNLTNLPPRAMAMATDCD